MNLNQNPSSSAPEVERLNRWTGLAVLLASVTMASGQVTNVQAVATATQALISYTAPDSGVCTVEVREGSSQGPLVHDVDPALFPGSNLDSRAANVNTGRRRVFVAGKRTSEPALDQRRYSRALQADTIHAFKITCPVGVLATGQFSTMNPPVGHTYNDPLPVDPNQPGQLSWPSLLWNQRDQWIVDPLTGFRIKQFDSPRDAVEFIGSGNFATASNVTGSTDWTNPGAVTADDSSAATYSGTTRGWLFVQLNLGLVAAHNPSTASPNTLVPTFNAWCSSSDCSGASADDRRIQFCLTIDGVSCGSDMLEAALAACSSGCTGSGNRFAAIANPTPILADWFASNNGYSRFDSTSLAKRSGNVNRNGASVILINGDRFDLRWSAGSTITINSQPYMIASVDSDGTLTLGGSPAGTDSSVQYTASNAGILIRKKTSSTHQISIQYISYSYETGVAATSESTGDEDAFANCSTAVVAGPAGEMGWHCQVSGTLYWVGQDTGTVNRLGRDVPPYNGAADGWNQQQCQSGAYWDSADANSLYCPTNSLSGHLYLLKMTYNGSNTDVGDLAITQAVVACGSAPCWTITNLTPGATTLDQQASAFHPDWQASKFHTKSFTLFGRMGSTNSLTFMARRDELNDSMAFLFRFDLNTLKIVGGIPTWRYWPLRWAGMHGPFNLNEPSWVHVASTFFRGPTTGDDIAAGNGPYYSTITSGPVSTGGQQCPSRPANSPIAAADWPTGGDQCLVVTVDGEPGDPTPKKYSSGTISVSGTSVTGTNTYWTNFMDGTQMKIGNSIYTFTYVASNQGTLDSSPGTISDSPYTLYLEQVNNPKVGNPNFAYLQDAEVRDIFCASNQSGCSIVQYERNEFLRLIIKNGNTWTLQRSYGVLPHAVRYPLNANAWLIATTSTCIFTAEAPCAESRAAWNALLDPYGYNADQTTVLTDAAEKGCCHATRQNGVNVDLALACPSRDNGGSGCYFARLNGIPAAYSDPGYLVSNNPLFHGILGVGAPNAVDSHPSHQQTAPPATSNETSWFGDARPFLGAIDGFGSAATPGVLVAGTLYKFTAAQTARLRPRILPTMAACGANTLRNMSGPASSISSGASDNYKYCIALTGGECTNGSAPGDVYVNCPQIKLPYCTFQGVGNTDPDTRDICVVDMGAYALNNIQVGIKKPDPDGTGGRRVTSGLSHYHWLNPFWNLKILPNGRWMLVWSVFTQNQRDALLLVKLPKFPAPDGINRGDFIPFTVTVPTPQVAGVTNAVVQFGYDKNYFCTSRGEACVQGAVTDPANVPFHYKSENPNGIPCASGCTIAVQALSQRVLYYQVLLRDGGNNVVGQLAPDVALIP